jgi:hypothetical protein
MLLQAANALFVIYKNTSSEVSAHRPKIGLEQLFEIR